jgi:hypothetical protein
MTRTNLLPVSLLPMILAALLLPSMAPAQGKSKQPPAADAVVPAPRSASVPSPGELNPVVLEVLRRYPTDGSHDYHWPRSGDEAKWRGCTKDLRYDGELLSAGDAKGRAYCCGLTFEVFLDAWMLWCERTERPQRISGLKLADVRRLQTQWFGSAKDRSCMRTALVDNQLGIEITDWEQARAGDFVQLWRTDGSGHSVVFLEWVRSGSKKEIVGMRYWSTQKSTKGIGERVEMFAAPGETATKPALVRRDELWICRVGVPAKR